VINRIKSGAKVKQTEERHATGVGCNIRIGEQPQHSRLGGVVTPCRLIGAPAGYRYSAGKC